MREGLAGGGQRRRGAGRHKGQEAEENMSAEETSKLAVFKGKRITKALHEGEWWFSIRIPVNVSQFLLFPWLFAR